MMEKNFEGNKDSIEGKTPAEAIEVIKEKFAGRDGIGPALDIALSNSISTALDQSELIFQGDVGESFKNVHTVETLWHEAPLHAPEKEEFFGILRDFLEILEKYQLHPRYNTTIVHANNGESIDSDEKRELREELKKIGKKISDWVSSMQQ